MKESKHKENILNLIEEKDIGLIVYDFDQVIYNLEWNFGSTVNEFMTELYDQITEIDSEIISDREAFISSGYPFSEMNEIGRRHGREAQLPVEELFRKKETMSLDKATRNDDVIQLISELEVSQVIWSNNLKETIMALLERAGILSRINLLVTLDSGLLSKPDPAGFTQVKEAFPEVPAEKMLFVGDSLRSDKVVADAVGMHFYHYKS